MPAQGFVIDSGDDSDVKLAKARIKESDKSVQSLTSRIKSLRLHRATAPTKSTATTTTTTRAMIREIGGQGLGSATVTDS